MAARECGTFRPWEDAVLLYTAVANHTPKDIAVNAEFMAIGPRRSESIGGSMAPAHGTWMLASAVLSN